MADKSAEDLESGVGLIAGLGPDDLLMLLHLYEAVGGEAGRDVKEVERLMGDRGHDGGTAVYYRKLARLEAVCGRRLIERGAGSKRARATRDADAVFRQVRRVIDEMRQLRDLRPRKQVIVGGTNAIFTYHLVKILADSGYLGHHPDTDLVMREGEWWDVLRDLAAGRIDFGMGPWVADRPAEYHAVQIAALPRVLVFHPGHPFARLPAGGPFNLNSLSCETLLVTPQEAVPRFQWDLLPHPEPGWGRRITLQTLGEIRVWARHGLGVGISNRGYELPGDSRELIDSRDVSAQLGYAEVYAYLPAGGVEAIGSEEGRELAKVVLASAHAATGGGDFGH
jgi:DNA-binding transcriptional LysR family regulator